MQVTRRSIALATLLSAFPQLSAQTKVSDAKDLRITLKVENRPLRDVVAVIREKVGVTINMDDGIDDTVTIDVEHVCWRTALALVVEKAECVMFERGRYLIKKT